MKLSQRGCLALLALIAAIAIANSPAMVQQQGSSSIVFIMGDEVGWSNIRELVRCGFLDSRTMT